jgi:hypothetical protein
MKIVTHVLIFRVQGPSSSSIADRKKWDAREAEAVAAEEAAVAAGRSTIQPATVTFEHIHSVIAGKKGEDDKVVLDDICGSARPGRLLVVRP